MRVWIVQQDYGYEGLKDLLGAFLSQDEADAFAGSLSANYGCGIKVHSTDLMRFIPAQIKAADAPDDPGDKHDLA